MPPHRQGATQALVGQLLIFVFGLVVFLKASAWQWRGLGVMFAVWGIAAAVGGAILRQRAKPRRRAPTPAAAAPRPTTETPAAKPKPGLAKPPTLKPPGK